MSPTLRRPTLLRPTLGGAPWRGLVVSAAVLALGLSACGGSSTGNGPMPAMSGQSRTTSSSPSTPTTSATPASGAHNDSDVQFATQMIPHHQQAVVMADLAATRATDTQVRDLAASVKAAQGPEITRMGGWLTGWDEPVPTGSTMGGMGGMGGHDLNGMMSDQDMQKLAAMTGAEFDRAFLTGMLTHHQGAVTMSHDELRQGGNPEAKQLAQQIAASQGREITTMNGLLARPGR